MHWESYYIDPKQVMGDQLRITGDELHHLGRVKRKQPGDIVWAVDGQGVAYETEIVEITKKEAFCHIIKTRRRLGEPISEVTLAQGVIKGERFDWLIEKAVEIGVSRIIPIQSENSVLKAGPQKLVRWRRVALAAMKQCGRSVLPEITEPKSFKKIVGLGTDCALRLIAEAGEQSTPVQVNGKGNRKALLIVGPEGGFSDSEVALARENGFQPVTLGPRRLRAETAGIVLASLVLGQLGELK
jgi:16S rRNA (uracil1498-N3)-methyltransferase